MKKTKYLLLAFFFIPIVAIGQKKDTFNLVIRITGGYTDAITSTEMGIMRENAIRTSTGVIGFSAGLLTNKKSEFGVGVEYLSQTTMTNSFLYLPEIFYGEEIARSNVNIFLGKVYFANHYRLFSRLYFAPKFAFGYGKANGIRQSTRQSITDLKIPDFLHIQNTNGYPIMSKSEEKINYDYFAMDLTPAFNFYFNKHFALTLETGAFQISFIDVKWENRQWLANISPIYWNVGFAFVL